MEVPLASGEEPLWVSDVSASEQYTGIALILDLRFIRCVKWFNTCLN